MKTFVLAAAVLLFVHGAAYADTIASTPLAEFASVEISTPISLPASELSPGSQANNGSSSNFAQLAISKTVPIPSSLIFTLIALFVVGMRLMGLRQARTLAVQERHSHHGKAEMFRALHAERSSRD